MSWSGEDVAAARPSESVPEEAAVSQPSGSVPPPAQRRRGTRVRAGNAMDRTRRALLEGAQRCVERVGVRRSTMNDIAAAGGVAKATLYNHFRTKDEVWAALVETQVRALGAECARIAADGDLGAALAWGAATLREHQALRRVASDEPALLLGLLAPDDGPGWATARAVVADTLAAAGLETPATGIDTLLRWWVSQVLWPTSVEDAVATAVLLAGLPPEASAT